MSQNFLFLNLVLVHKLFLRTYPLHASVFKKLYFLLFYLMHQAIVTVSSSAQYSSHTFVHSFHSHTHTHGHASTHTHTRRNKDFKSTFWTMFIFNIYPHIINIAFQSPSDIRLTKSCRLAEAEHYLIGC